MRRIMPRGSRKVQTRSITTLREGMPSLSLEEHKHKQTIMLWTHPA